MYLCVMQKYIFSYFVERMQQIPASNPMTAPIQPIEPRLIRSTTLPPMNDPVPMPRLKIPEKNAIATDPAAPACKMISDCAATLNAVDVNPQYAHTHNNEIKDTVDGFNSNNTIAILSVMRRKNPTLFLEQNFENRTLPRIPATPNIDKDSVIHVSDSFAMEDMNGSIQLQAVQ